MSSSEPAARTESDTILIDVRKLSKTFKTGLFQRRLVEAIKGVSFQVLRGQVAGFLGPNGSG
ncbi:MAG: methionine ABC transporter ATP-binding protein, partial [Deltaproteobacteria bacterium]|nr:methionine ABC transporter ATP-binding protein [Deltaproteobacteria bacterium]